MTTDTIPALPIGWFQLARTEELPVGAVVPLRYLGKDLVLWRDVTGDAHVFDAFCPHRGAHLGHGGIVDNRSIRCPFHGWEYDANGACTVAPGARPGDAAIGAHPVSEQIGLIMFWYHPDGEQPQWLVPLEAELGAEELSEPMHASWRIQARWHQVAENAVDMAHFPHVHGTAQRPHCTYAEDGSSFVVVSHHQVQGARKVRQQDITSTNYGPGIGLVRFSGTVDGRLIPAVTPIDEQTIDLRFTFYARRVGSASVTKMIRDAFAAELVRQVGQDMRIWEHQQLDARSSTNMQEPPIVAVHAWARRFAPHR